MPRLGAGELLSNVLGTLFVYVVVFPAAIAVLFFVAGQNTSLLYALLTVYFLLLVVAGLVWVSRKIR